MPNRFVGYHPGMATTTRRRPKPKAAAQPVWLPAQRTSYLIDSVGGVRRLAKILCVSASQPSRWRSGEERPGPVASRRLLDLDHVFSRALLLWEEPIALDWLESPNGYLDGARPIDVLGARGASAVIDALDAAQSGAFA